MLAALIVIFCKNYYMINTPKNEKSIDEAEKTKEIQCITIHWDHKSYCSNKITNLTIGIGNSYSDKNS